MEQTIAQEFCRQTKLHMDELLSSQHLRIDVEKLISVLLATIDFETNVQDRFSKGKDLPDEEAIVRTDKEGRIIVETGTAEEIKKRY